MEISNWLLLNNNWLLVTEPLPKHCTRRWAWELSHSPTWKGRGHKILSLCITCHDKQSKGIIECPKVLLACRQIVEIIASPPNSPYRLCKKHTSFLYMCQLLFDLKTVLINFFSFSFSSVFLTYTIYVYIYVFTNTVYVYCN